MRTVVLVIHNVRSTLNVGSMFRTAEGLGVEKIFLTGYTPYPESNNDSRLPHQRRKISLQIHKTALGAEYLVKWQHLEELAECAKELTKGGYELFALEQTPKAVHLAKLKTSTRVALVVGNELTGLDKKALKLIQNHVQIPMSGRKESFNVAVAAGIALYHLCYL
jgi:23S rRNA (guanosine2251-2'-O)-methyltransferase